MKLSRETVGYQAILLGVVTLVASAALAVADHQTRAAIAAAETRDLEFSLSQVLPANFSDNDLVADTVVVGDASGTPIKVYRARKGSEVKGVIFQVIGKGYAGPVVIVMGVDREGTVLGVRVTRHSETPGLGDKIDAAKSNWIFGFKGKSLEQPPIARWAVKKDGGEFDQFTGATITPRAVVSAVKQGLIFYRSHRAELIGEALTADGSAPR